MELKFASIEEVKDFVAQLKGTRGKKGDTDDEGPKAPAPLMPPAATVAQFTPPPNQGFTAFPGPGAVTVAPEVMALVQRINAKIDGAVASGQPTDAVLNWFRQQCGAEAANATLDQIKTAFLFKLTIPALENIAKLMGA